MTIFALICLTYIELNGCAVVKVVSIDVPKWSPVSCLELFSERIRPAVLFCEKKAKGPLV
jgi:hypothetical protein